MLRLFQKVIQIVIRNLRLKNVFIEKQKVSTFGYEFESGCVSKIQLKNNRERELEADEFGAMLLVKTSMNPIKAIKESTNLNSNISLHLGKIPVVLILLHLKGLEVIENRYAFAHTKYPMLAMLFESYRTHPSDEKRKNNLNQKMSRIINERRDFLFNKELLLDV